MVRPKSKHHGGGASSKAIKNERTNEVRSKKNWLAPSKFELFEQEARKYLLDGLRRLRHWICNGHAVCIDFSETKQMGVSGTLLFLAEIRRLIKHVKPAPMITCVLPLNQKVGQVLEQIQFFSLLGIKTNFLPQDEDVVNWRFAHGNKVIGEKYEDILSHYDGSIAEPLQVDLFKGLTEAMANVHHHAYELPRCDGTQVTESREWWMFSQARDQTLSVAFIDLGAGIPRTLPQKNPRLWKKLLHAFKKPKDSNAIAYALHEGRTRTQKSHRGKGLGQIARVIDEAAEGARMTILSNYGSLTRFNRQQRSYEYSDSIQGTFIWWQLPLLFKEAL
jgi:hypothetical protein